MSSDQYTEARHRAILAAQGVPLMKYAIRIIGVANMEHQPHPLSGAFIQSYDVTTLNEQGAYSGGDLEVCDTITKAKHFADQFEAMNFWRTESPYGNRADGKPDRPLTAFTVEIVPVHS